MSQSEPGDLCVAIHDVAPATWAECLHLLHALQAVGEFPITWLVVPRYHGNAERSRACENMLERLLGEGHELALHGLTHQDEAALGGQPWQRFLRTVYTQREGEFAAIDGRDARRRIELGLRWFHERGWPVSGFVAPAWLMGSAAWQVIGDYPFTYTSSYSRLYVLEPRMSVFSPALVYTARNCAGRCLSPAAVSATARLLRRRPVLRIALHPRDAHFPGLVRHAQGLIEALLQARSASTKADVVLRLTSAVTSPSSPPATSDGANSPRITSGGGNTGRHHEH